MARRKRSTEQEEVTLSMTPLIDVTFLLLIFFMCAMKFKTLERKVAAHLPTNRGIANTKIVIEEVLTIKVTLKRTPGETVTRVKPEGNVAVAEAVEVPTVPTSAVEVRVCVTPSSLRSFSWIVVPRGIFDASSWIVTSVGLSIDKNDS